MKYNGSFMIITLMWILTTLLLQNSDYCEYEDEFQKQVFITEIGIFDEEKNLIGIAKLANPVLKKESDSYTFKLNLDM